MYKLKSNLTPAWCDNKKILCRIDLNIDPADGADQLRMHALLSTLHVFLASKNASVLLLTHRGRPLGIDLTYTTQSLLPLFAAHHIPVRFAQSLEEARVQLQSPGLVLFENVRFFPSEREGDIGWAKRLRELGDAYVFDAFASAHTSDVTVALLPTLFDTHERTIGLLVEQELQHLNKFSNAPAAQTAVVLSGGKPESKIKYVPAFAQKGYLQCLLPLLDTEYKKQHYSFDRVIVANDYLVSPHGFTARDMKVVSATELSEHHGTDIAVLSIGPKTAQLMLDVLDPYDYLFINGIPGDFKQPEMTLIFQYCLQKILEKERLQVVVGGGDTVAALQAWGLLDQVTYASTAGGAMLAYLADEKLPGLEAFL